MKRVAPKIAHRAAIFILVSAHHRLRGILDNFKVMTFGNGGNGVHLASNAGIVHDDNCLGALGDRRLNFGFVNVHGIGANVDKNRNRSADEN